MSSDAMRLPDWEQRLADLIAAYQGGGFVWGKRDCLTFCLDAAEAMTGQRRWSQEHTYASPLQAVRWGRACGFRDMAEGFASVFSEVPPAVARRGDIGVVCAGASAGGVVVLGADLIGMGGDGLSLVPRSQMSRAFRVG